MARTLINLTTGMEDGEKVTVAFLVAGAALDRGQDVAMFLTQEAVRLAEPGTAEGTFCEGCPPLERLFAQFDERGGELWLCPFCFNSRHLDEADIVPNAKIAGATPMWQWAGEDATVIGY